MGSDIVRELKLVSRASLEPADPATEVPKLEEDSRSEILRVAWSAIVTVCRIRLQGCGARVFRGPVEERRVVTRQGLGLVDAETSATILEEHLMATTNATRKTTPKPAVLGVR